jgi:hypothetical protein
LFLQEFTLRETLRESGAAAARMAQKREVKIEYEIRPEITTIVSDQGRLDRCIQLHRVGVGRSPVGDDSKNHCDSQQPFAAATEDQLTRRAGARNGSSIDPESSGADDPNINHLGIIIARRP